MTCEPVRIDSWPRGILHLDGDGFFASIEQAIHPELKGRPVVTGIERGIVAAASYEAKAYGVKRGVPLSEVRKLCPQCVMLPSDYETYSLFSKRMYAIMRDFTPEVEEYSIDEAFADLTGFRMLYHCSYEEIARRMKIQVEKDLGITVSVGLSLSKSLAKLCSKFRKPSGFTAVPGHQLHILLARTPLEKVWGFGPNKTAYLNKLGLKTAYDYVRLSRDFVKRRLGKIGVEIWSELQGEYVYKIDVNAKQEYQSICKSKTFLPPSPDPDYVKAQLLRNLESACIKARRYDLVAGRMTVYLKRQNFTTVGLEAVLSRPTVATLQLAPLARGLFEKIFEGGTEYRATGVVLSHLEKAKPIQFGLFENPLQAVKIEEASKAIDAINAHYGKHSIFVGDALKLQGRPRGKNDIRTYRRDHLLPGETARRHIGLPLLAVDPDSRIIGACADATPKPPRILN
ncbi:MAG TPA: DNA polymerase IV [bacterium]|nr:DNA polymerase IV [bacterium]